MDSSAVWSLTARWIIPVCSPPLPGGSLRIRGNRIESIDPKGAETADIDLGDAAVLPGFVNLHTHLDLSGMAMSDAPVGDFTGWLRHVIAHRQSQTPQQINAAIAAGLEQSIHHGTTLLGDISSGGHSRSILAKSGIRSVVFYELLGLTEERAESAWREAEDWLESSPSTAKCRLGISPHAPYTVRRSLFERTAALPKDIPIAIHIAETEAETQLLKEKNGPFVDFLKELGAWDPSGLIRDVDELIQWYRKHRLLLVHGNYLALEKKLPQSSTLVFCPRTHAAFGHPPHPAINCDHDRPSVALGTDSLASNPGLDMLGEGRQLYQNHPRIPARQIVRWLTLAGAQALSWDNETGSLAPGKSADLVVVPLNNCSAGDPCQMVLESGGPPNGVTCSGAWIHGGPI